MICTILPPDGTVQLYDLACAFEDGSTLRGTGIQYGAALFYGFDRAPLDEADCGVVGYVITPEAISGQWVLLGDPGLGIEAGERID